MQSLQGQGKAVIFSTHDFEQGKAIARRLVALEAGKVRYDGPVGEGVRSQETGVGRPELEARS
jgi:energy-coupling factor transporter ATP-binding protein EcfA2